LFSRPRTRKECRSNWQQKRVSQWLPSDEEDYSTPLDKLQIFRNEDDRVAMIADTWQRYHVVIIGGGTAGASLANQLAKILRYSKTPLDVAVIDYSRAHFYTPGWIFSSVRKLDRMRTVRFMSQVIAPEITLIPDRVIVVDPNQKFLLTKLGRVIQYDFLVIASGYEFDWLSFAKKIPSGYRSLKLASCFSFDYCETLWKHMLVKLQPRGECVFYEERGPSLRSIAPFSTLFLADAMIAEHFRLWKLRYITPRSEEEIFPLPQYNDLIRDLILENKMILECGSELVDVNAKGAVVRARNGYTYQRNCHVLHYTPQHQPISFLMNTPLLDESGFVNVNPYTLQNPQFPNVFACGDCASIPTLKSIFGTAQQIPIVLHNLLVTMAGTKTPLLEYDGYSFAPLYTEYGKALWIKTDYSQQAMPMDTPPKFKPRKYWWKICRYLIPPFYWYSIVPGRYKGLPWWLHNPNKAHSLKQEAKTVN
jgi:thioredoxin reductase